MRLRRAAERRRAGLAFKASPSHIRATMQPNLSPEDYAAIAALLRDTIAADRFPPSPRVRRWVWYLTEVGWAGTLQE